MSFTIFDKECVECGNTYPSFRRFNTCSDECNKIYLNKKSRYRQSFIFHPKIIKKCITCGKEFQVKRNAKTCSKDCRVKRRKILTQMNSRKPEQLAKRKEYNVKYRMLRQAMIAFRILFT